MRSLRIVLVMPDAPLPFGDAAARWYYVLLRGLVQRGHRVTALAACARPKDVAASVDLFPAGTFDLQCFSHGSGPRGLAGKVSTLRRPYSYLFTTAFRHAVERAVGAGCDVLHLEQLWTGWLGLRYTSRALLNLHYLFSIDLAQARPGSIGEHARQILSCRAERRLLGCFRNISTLTPRLTQRTQQIAPRASVYTVPLGLDTSLYPLAGDANHNSHPVVSLIGSFNWGPTLSAGHRLIDRLWPEIHRRVPNARLRLVGRRARQALPGYLHLPGVEVIEDVPDTRPYFADTDVMLYAPLAGSGMKVKVLEAFALGTPVVTNADGVEGIEAIDGTHAGIAEDDAALVERTVALLNSPALRQQRRLAARQLVETTCSPVTTVGRVEEVYNTIVSKAGK